MLSNFLFRVRQYLKDNRRKVIKWALILFAALLVFLAIRRIVEWSQGRQYEKRVQALERIIDAADAKAKEAQQQADVLKTALEIKYAQLEAVQGRAQTAEANLAKARSNAGQLRVIYEESRNAPIPTNISNCGACEELARAGWSCK